MCDAPADQTCETHSNKPTITQFHEDGEGAPRVAATKKHHINVAERETRGDVNHKRSRARHKQSKKDTGRASPSFERRQTSRHIERFACLRRRRRRLSRLRRRASLACWASDGVELSGAWRAVGVAMMGEARVSPSGSRDAGAHAASGRARECRPRGARGQHLTARPVAAPPSLINSEPAPRRCGARFGCGAGEHVRERELERGRGQEGADALGD